MRIFQRTLKRLKLKLKNVKTCSTDITSAVLTELEGNELIKMTVKDSYSISPSGTFKPRKLV